MTTCEQFHHELGGYVLGGLTGEEIARVEGHLRQCAGCREELEELAGIPALLELSAETPARPSRDLRDRVLAVVGQAPSRARGRAALVRPVAAGFVGLLLGAAAMLSIVSGPPADAAVAFGGDPDSVVTGDAELRDTPSGVQLDLDASGLERGVGVAYYHVWLEWPSGERISAGTVLPDDDGGVEAALTCGGELDDYVALTITTHPSAPAYAAPEDDDGEVLVRAELP